jgi:hypothetical protein
VLLRVFKRSDRQEPLGNPNRSVSRLAFRLVLYSATACHVNFDNEDDDPEKEPRRMCEGTLRAAIGRVGSHPSETASHIQANSHSKQSPKGLALWCRASCLPGPVGLGKMHPGGMPDTESNAVIVNRYLRLNGGCRRLKSLTGGLRVGPFAAATSGYYLATLRVAGTVQPSGLPALL